MGFALLRIVAYRLGGLSSYELIYTNYMVYLARTGQLRCLSTQVAGSGANPLARQPQRIDTHGFAAQGTVYFRRPMAW